MKLHQRIEQAREEIARLNIEVCRLYTAIHDEHVHFARVRAELKQAKEYELLGALSDFVSKRQAVNNSILRYLEEITALDGYSGERELLGLRLGAPPRTGGDVLMRGGGVTDGLQDDSDSGSEAEDEEEIAQRGGVIDFISEISLS